MSESEELRALRWSHVRFGTQFVTLYGAHEQPVGTFAGMMMAWTNAPVGSFGTGMEAP